MLDTSKYSQNKGSTNQGQSKYMNLACRANQVKLGNFQENSAETQM